MIAKLQLTKEDYMILDSYKNMVDALSAYLGDAYEIILHSLEDPQHSVIAIANGFHTGRAIGAPITDLAIHWLEKIESDPDSPDHHAYFSKNKLGEPLKSTTIAIRGHQGNVIGLLCMNFYLGTPLIHIMSDLLPQEALTLEEKFTASVTSVETEIENAREQVRLDPTISAGQSNKEIIRLLQQRHVFEIKNAVEQVANALNISVNTVYFHLRNIVKETL